MTSERWTPKRKANVVLAAKGAIPRAELLRVNGLTEDELRSWERLYARYGEPGLRATRIQVYPYEGIGR